MLALPAASQQRPPAPDQGALTRIFWRGVDALDLIFRSVGVLSGGVERGELWAVELDAGGPYRIGSATDLAWPVQARDGATILALRGQQLVRLRVSGVMEPVPGAEADWEKLLGIDADGVVIGFVSGTPRVHPAMLRPGGTVMLAPQPDTPEERQRVARLLSENRAYAGEIDLIVERSARGGRGFDIVLVAAGQRRLLTDCGDIACGQPSLSPDRRRVLFIRAARQ